MVPITFKFKIKINHLFLSDLEFTFKKTHDFKILKILKRTIQNIEFYISILSIFSHSASNLPDLRKLNFITQIGMSCVIWYTCDHSKHQEVQRNVLESWNIRWNRLDFLCSKKLLLHKKWSLLTSMCVV